MYAELFFGTDMYECRCLLQADLCQQHPQFSWNPADDEQRVGRFPQYMGLQTMTGLALILEVFHAAEASCQIRADTQVAESDYTAILDVL